jgi:hydrogenase expression/formation protein HypC
VSSNLPPASVPDPDLHCDPEDACVTCGDVAVQMRVLALDDQRGLALCATNRDQRETVEIALVAPVAAGDELLVHAGTAIAVVGDRDTPGRGTEGVLR